MENSIRKKVQQKYRRKLRVRSHLRGTIQRPRLCVVKTNMHLYAQIIDDEQGQTLASLSTLSEELRQTEFNRKNKASAHELGLRLALLAKEKGIEQVVFDRGASKYHGVIAALADAARSNGLQF